MHPRPPTSTLFPYTTLFRSRADVNAGWQVVREEDDLRVARLHVIERAPEGIRPDVAAAFLFFVRAAGVLVFVALVVVAVRSEEHTSELQSQSNLVCRLLLEK